MLPELSTYTVLPSPVKAVVRCEGGGGNSGVFVEEYAKKGVTGELDRRLAITLQSGKVITTTGITAMDRIILSEKITEQKGAREIWIDVLREKFSVTNSEVDQWSDDVWLNGMRSYLTDMVPEHDWTGVAFDEGIKAAHVYLNEQANASSPPEVIALKEIFNKLDENLNLQKEIAKASDRWSWIIVVLVLCVGLTAILPGLLWQLGALLTGVFTAICIRIRNGA